MADFKKKGKVTKDELWKAKYREPAGVKDWDYFSILPDTWFWVSVDQAGDSQGQVVLTGPFGSNLGKEDFTKSGIPVLTIGCLQEDGIKLSRAMFVSKLKSEDLIRYKLKVGDLLFYRMAAVGRVGFVTSEFEGALFNYHIMRLRLHSDAILQKYFVFYVRGSSRFLRRRLAGSWWIFEMINNMEPLKGVMRHWAELTDRSDLRSTYLLSIYILFYNVFHI